MPRSLEVNCNDAADIGSGPRAELTRKRSICPVGNGVSPSQVFNSHKTQELSLPAAACEAGNLLPHAPAPGMTRPNGARQVRQHAVIGAGEATRALQWPTTVCVARRAEWRMGGRRQFAFAAASPSGSNISVGLEVTATSGGPAIEGNAVHARRFYRRPVPPRELSALARAWCPDRTHLSWRPDAR
jgi:hypothetical protein